jgi:hypothetical protein
MAVVLIEGVLDGCPGGTLTVACCGWSTCTAASLLEGTCFLTPEGGLPGRALNLRLLPLPGLDTSVCFGLLLFREVGSLLLLYGMPLKPPLI